MRMPRLIGSLVAAACLLAPAAATAVTHSGPRYINPFADPRWEAGRIDMGMDWAPLRRLPVLAVGDAVILGSSNHSGWPGGRYIFYQLTDGPLAGDVIYVAEHLTKLALAGRHVRAGQQIAVAVPGYPYIEMGWADADGNTRAEPMLPRGQADELRPRDGAVPRGPRREHRRHAAARRRAAVRQALLSLARAPRYGGPPDPARR